jgi:hypothetical protein
MAHQLNKKQDTTYQKQDVPLMPRQPITDSETVPAGAVSFANKFVEAYDKKKKSADKIGIKAALKQGASIAMKKYF